MSELPINLPPRILGGNKQAVTADWANSIREAIGRLESRTTRRFRNTVGGSSETPPFELTARNDAGTIKWQVSSERSSVTNGTNGDAYDLGPSGADWIATSPKKFDTEHSLASPATKYIVLKAAVDASMEASDWTLADVDAADAEEVGLDGGTPEAQDEIRLLIGKITVDTGTDPDTVTVTQAVFSQQRTTIGFLNGLEVLVFEPCGINLDDL